MSLAISTDQTPSFPLQTGHDQSAGWGDLECPPEDIASGSQSNTSTQEDLTSDRNSEDPQFPTFAPSYDTDTDSSPFLTRLSTLLLSSSHPSAARLAHCFLHANIAPPISKSALAELEIPRIRDNARLRHDINFDRELFFRPNLDGDRGRAKRRDDAAYWDALTAELALYALLHRSADSPGCPGLARAAQRRIPALLATVRDVLEVLVPARAALFREQLDVAACMQMVANRVCDADRVARPLAGVLKEHCAPVRDVWVDAMVAKIEGGVAAGDWGVVVAGLRDLLGILEAMKLDVANHQIQYMRPKLIEDTIAFEQGCYQSAPFDLTSARLWFLSHWNRHVHADVDAQICTPACATRTFVHALVDLLLVPSLPIPATFHRDHDRLLALRSSLSTILHLSACLSTAAALLRHFAPISHLTSTHRNHLLSALSAVLPASPQPHPWPTTALEPAATELARLIHSLLPSPPSPATLYDTALAHLTRACARLAGPTPTPDVRALAAHLLHRTHAHLAAFATASPLDVHDAFVAHPSAAPDAAADEGLTLPPAFELLRPRLRDAVRRLAPVAILHWRVWSPLAYVPSPVGGQRTPVTESRGAESGVAPFLDASAGGQAVAEVTVGGGERSGRQVEAT